MALFVAGKEVGADEALGTAIDVALVDLFGRVWETALATAAAASSTR